MKKIHNFIRTLPVLAALVFGSGAAQAGWIVIADADGTDSATNPTNGGTSNSPASVAAWLQDLENLAAPPALIDAGDVADASGLWSLTNIDAGAQYLSLHYGNFPGGMGLSRDYGNVLIAFRCVVDEVSCATFSAPGSGLSNYRVFGTATAVPEPATLALLGAGLVGMGLARRRRRDPAQH
jgi:hypothetical protein